MELLPHVIHTYMYIIKFSMFQRCTSTLPRHPVHMLYFSIDAPQLSQGVFSMCIWLLHFNPPKVSFYDSVNLTLLPLYTSFPLMAPQIEFKHSTLFSRVVHTHLYHEYHLIFSSIQFQNTYIFTHTYIHTIMIHHVDQTRFHVYTCLFMNVVIPELVWPCVRSFL